MSEETNETLGNDEAMDITEIETSHHEAAPEPRKTYGPMSSSEFEAKLTEFFSKHQKSKLRLVPKIAREFEGNEGEVLEHLHNKYVLGITSTKGGKKKGAKKKLAASGHGHGHGDHGDSHTHEIEGAEAKPKSKKKMIIIIIVLVVVLGGGGAAAFMFKDKLFGGGHGTEHGPAAGHDAKADSHGAAEKPKVEPATTPAVDSATTGGADTAAAAHPAGAEHGAAEHGGGH